MNYSSFCEYLLAALTNQMEHGVKISKDYIMQKWMSDRSLSVKKQEVPLYGDVP